MMGLPARRYPLWAGRAAVLLAIAVSALTLRSSVTSLSPLLHTIGPEFGFGAGTIGVIGTLPPACFALFGACTPFLVRRVGLEFAAAAAMALTTIGVIVRAFAGGTESLIGLSVVALAGMGIAGVAIPPLVREYFSDRLALVSSVYLIALHLGALVPPLVSVPLAHAIGWRAAIGVWGLIATVAAVLWIVQLQHRHRRVQHHQAQHISQAEALAIGVLPRHAWRSPTVWNLTVLFGLTSGNVFILFTWLPTLTTDAGHDAAFGGVMVAVLITVSMLIGIFAPTLTVRMRNPTPLIESCVALYVAGYAGLALAPQVMTLLWVIFLGAGSSLFIIAQTMINTHSRTLAGSAVTSGFVQGVGGAIAVIGPVFFGAIHAWTGSWLASYGFVAITLAGIAVTGYRERHHRTIEEDIRTALPPSLIEAQMARK
jgi:CP family cyanate transporter-like MFS transporter